MVTLTVDIAKWDLEAEGYHHEDDCNTQAKESEYEKAIQDLHCQAQHVTLYAMNCRQLPCRGLY